MSRLGSGARCAGRAVGRGGGVGETEVLEKNPGGFFYPNPTNY